MSKVVQPTSVITPPSCCNHQTKRKRCAAAAALALHQSSSFSPSLLSPPVSPRKAAMRLEDLLSLCLRSLGGNRRDCVTSLFSADYMLCVMGNFDMPLPKDVCVCATAMLSAAVRLPLSPAEQKDQQKEPVGLGLYQNETRLRQLLFARMVVNNGTRDLEQYCCESNWKGDTWPWMRTDNGGVMLRIELAPTLLSSKATAGAGWTDDGQEEADDRVVAVLLPDHFLHRQHSIGSCTLRHLDFSALDGSMRRIGDHCMVGCDALQTVQFPKKSLEAIGHRCMVDCTRLTTVDLSATQVRAIGNYFLSGCRAVTRVCLPDTIEEIGSACCEDCVSLTSLDLSTTALRTIGHHFLSRCTAITEVRLPDTLEAVGSAFVWHCTSLTPKPELNPTVVRVSGGNDFLRHVSCRTAMIDIQQHTAMLSAGEWANQARFGFKQKGFVKTALS